ncbi:MAG: sigma 54-interacting transcriptional regulator [Candidatus Latescibacteria bacterium]|nr:sigma 54-interacting transcriptional regulator [Candidatus Latescibacterota bacterium]
MASNPDHDQQLQDQIQFCMTQRQNLEAIFNSVADGILALNLELRISNLNTTAQRLLETTLQEAVGQSCLDRLGASAELAALLRERRQVDGYRYTLHTRDQGEHLLSLSLRPLLDPEGMEQGVVLILRDLTEIENLRRQLQGRHRFHGLIGKDHRLLELYQLIEDLADSEATVLILGESGTGKERVAEAIHQSSHRRAGPFVKVNCSALSEGLLESELFGHVKGAFTGAIRDKVGRFEQAAGGSIFLDEIGDLSLSVQVKLLRVLQEKEIERVGSGQTLKVDTRVIAATHRNLQLALQQGTFRSDLYYRLNVMPLELPPLRQRKEDIPLLVEHFIAKFNDQTQRRILRLDDAALSLLMDYDWPGNVRELENAIEHAFIKCRGEVLLPHHLPTALQDSHSRPQASAVLTPTVEKEQLLRVLTECHWNRSLAATRLGMHRTTLWRKMREWGIPAQPRS